MAPDDAEQKGRRRPGRGRKPGGEDKPRSGRSARSRERSRPRLRAGEAIALVAAILLFILMFFDWYGTKATTSAETLGGIVSGTGGGSAWDTLEVIPLFLMLAIVVTVGAALLAIYGYDWVHRIFRWTLCILLPLTLILTIGVLAGKAGGVTSHHVYGFNWTGFMTQFSAAAAYNITYAGYVSDYSRYLPRDTSRGKIIGYVFAGASIPAVWLIALGAWLAIGLGATDGLVGLQTAGNNFIGHLGGITGFLSAFALAATMGMNAYGASLTALAGVDAFRKVKPTRNARIITIVALAVIWFVIGKLITSSAVGVVDTALTLMLYLLVPWTVTNLIDFFFVRRGHYAILDIFHPNGIYGVWSYRGLIAYAAGFAAEIPFMVLLNVVSLKSYYTGPLASDLNSVDISWIVGAVVTAVVYWLLTRNLNAAAEQKAIAQSDAGLRQIDSGSA